MVSKMTISPLIRLALYLSMAILAEGCGAFQSHCDDVCDEFTWAPATTLKVASEGSDYWCSGVGRCRPQHVCAYWLTHCAGCDHNEMRVSRDAGFSGNGRIEQWRDRTLFRAKYGSDESCLTNLVETETKVTIEPIRIYGAVSIPPGKGVIFDLGPYEWTGYDGPTIQGVECNK